MSADRRIASVAFLVREYDEAIAWFTRCLGFEVIEDIPRGPAKRWVTVGPAGGATGGPTLLLARAVGDEQVSAVGRQAGGRVFLFLYTDNFSRDHARMLREGVRFEEEPRREPYGTVAVFTDLYGNRWDFIEPAHP